MDTYHRHIYGEGGFGGLSPPSRSLSPTCPFPPLSYSPAAHLRAPTWLHQQQAGKTERQGRWVSGSVVAGKEAEASTHPEVEHNALGKCEG